MPRRTWTDDDLRAAVADARSLHAVFLRLGLSVGGSQWVRLRAQILELGLDTSHWVHSLELARDRARDPAAFRHVLETVDLQEVVDLGGTRADVIRRLGFEPTRSLYRWLARVLEDRAIDVSRLDVGHVGMQRARRGPPRARRPLSEILVAASTYTSTSALKARLVDAGLLERVCAVCRIDRWRGQPLVLHLDHVNGQRDDHRLENLRLLCPNCHSQTGTYAGRNKGRRRPSTEG